MTADRRRKSRKHERGHLLAGLMAAVTIMVIFSTIAFQEWVEVQRRDNEAEMIFRAQDIVRAIQRFRQDHGGVGPQKLENLIEPGSRGQYYLRQLWKDPLVRDGEWGLLYEGPGRTIMDPNAIAEGMGDDLLNPTGDRRSGRRTGRESAQQQNRPLGNRNQVGGRGQTQGQGQQGQGQGQGQIPTDKVSFLARAASGGLPIAGVRSLSDDTPFRVYNGTSDYSQWLFSFFDLEPQQGRPLNQPAAGGGRQPPNPANPPGKP